MSMFTTNFIACQLEILQCGGGREGEWDLCHRPPVTKPDLHRIPSAVPVRSKHTPSVLGVHLECTAESAMRLVLCIHTTFYCTEQK